MTDFFQDPLFLNVLATVLLPGNPLFNISDHVFEKNWKVKNRCSHLMENSLNRLSYVPSASVYERFLDFGEGSVFDVTRNISQTICVTNHEQEEGYIQWIPGEYIFKRWTVLPVSAETLITYYVWFSDPENIFLVDPIASVIPPNDSRLFTIRFRQVIISATIIEIWRLAIFNFSIYPNIMFSNLGLSWMKRYTATSCAETISLRGTTMRTLTKWK